MRKLCAPKRDPAPFFLSFGVVGRYSTMIIRVTRHSKAERTVEVIVDSGAFKGCEAVYLAEKGLIVWKRMTHPFPRNYDPKPIEEAIVRAVRDYLQNSDT